jgi:hypothetical protein
MIGLNPEVVDKKLAIHLRRSGSILSLFNTNDWQTLWLLYQQEKESTHFKGLVEFECDSTTHSG